MTQLLNVTAPDAINDDELRELNQLLTRSQTGSTLPQDRARVRDYLTRFPDFARQLGAISDVSLQKITAHVAGDILSRESIQASANEFKRQLARPGDTPLEQFAIDQCVNAHILHYTIELHYIDAHNRGITSERSLYWEKRLTNSQKRYLRALDNLARLRRFAIPPIQINIAETQTNIAAGGGTNDSAGFQELDGAPIQKGTNPFYKIRENSRRFAGKIVEELELHGIVHQ